MELKIKEAFESLEQKPDRDELLKIFKDAWEMEKSRVFRPDRIKSQIAALLCCSSEMRGIIGYSDELVAFDEFIISALETLKSKLDKSPQGAMLVNAIQCYCVPVDPKEEPEPVQPEPVQAIDEGMRIWRRLDGQTTPF